MNSSPQAGTHDNNIATVNFDLLMPSSERRMDLVLPSPALCPVTHPSSTKLDRDPRWPLLNRWSTSPQAKGPIEALTMVEPSSSASIPTDGGSLRAMKPSPLVPVREGNLSTATPSTSVKTITEAGCRSEALSIAASPPVKGHPPIALEPLTSSPGPVGELMSFVETGELSRGKIGVLW